MHRHKDRNTSKHGNIKIVKHNKIYIKQINKIYKTHSDIKNNE